MIFLAVSEGSATSGNQGNCQFGWVLKENSCYYVSLFGLTWKQAVEACESKDSSIIKFTSRVERVSHLLTGCDLMYNISTTILLVMIVSDTYLLTTFSQKYKSDRSQYLGRSLGMGLRTPQNKFSFCS